MSTIIGINTQRNANCVVQASQLNGGNLAQSLNLQSIRIIKGQAVFPNITTNPGGAIGIVDINNYDNVPIQLAYGDVVICVVIENANPDVPLVSPNDLIFALISASNPPVYNEQTNSWDFNPEVGDITPITHGITLSNLNAGIRIISQLDLTTSVFNPWLIFGVLDFSSDNVLFTSPNPTLNITLLVMNPTHAI